MFRVLVANRGEIAVRIIRALRELKMESVAIYAVGDENSLHVKLADQAVCIGQANPLDSYLNIRKILAAAEITKANAIHPGYGFLSESPVFAEKVENQGLYFIGPTKKTMQRMGDKITARQTVDKAGVPIIPGSKSSVESVDEIKALAEEIGYPLVIKAASGGGGKGIRIVKEESQLERAFKEAKSEGNKYFNDDRVYVEAFIPVAKHVEVQVLGDGQSRYIHLGERDCSVQRKNQKLIEESPCSALTEEKREKICNDAVKVAKAAQYRSAGTIEFLVTEDAYYFIEMNARIQVEHTVTEMRTDIDLVREQLRIMQEGTLSLTQDDVHFYGHVIEARINAEDPQKAFRPTPGTVQRLHLPQGFNVRVDSLLYSGYTVSSYYDSLVAKVIVKGENRAHAIEKLKVTLDELVIDGFTTTADFLYAVLSYPPYYEGDARDVDIKFLDRHRIFKEGNEDES
ncbi:acetyl/propionyl/methylcrotonyl-CoA carboxylase subunit alpha [Staphylococcus pseudintermedius]|uniref:acetyl-CoA carboxylase biotin carboxylase subunit n=1 Tax=Staphylococcus pseudintermedius TaxID=283734 RepID=UPI0018F3563E|nr:acetyl-CoA carboxylase biotin carboxylase subunit [Staphylococcus pseudintermedius]EGQ0320107.1 acetyl-CoA carboxylase biotin carboxylase subunit [Staphylococcus pseudintermedius]EHS7159519.1 acetyl-CoA carboxylase biotin carboxylase subunit [Staphylococcus pseudintermedius]EHS7161648.1 acetyl-CoA carboxylase biotin carboxylase subunit [Staphylococcus pseudintermedius]EIE3643516.1 acetyl-CoA carboxylase biotin carboxylase subunit [Staphylococcus pseudintermedius]EIE3755985.1 acetyl-CoA carb